MRIGRALTPALVLFCVMMLAGCAGSGSGPPVVTAAVIAAVTGAWNLRKMGDDRLLREDPGGDYFKDWVTVLGQHVQYFLRWRAWEHLKTESDTNKVAAAIAAEYDLVRAFASDVVGLDVDAPSALVTGSDGNPHLDLADVLRVKSDDPATTDSLLKTHELRRWYRAMNIVWHAAATETELWTPNFSKAALKELLDRRLRVTERMLYQISLDVEKQGQLEPTDANPHGPWEDGVRVRMFQYPFIDADLADKVGAANIGPGKIWALSFDGTLLNYTEGNGRRIRAPAAAAFPPATGPGSDSYRHDFVPGANPAGSIDVLFTPSTDWWDRSWIFCDHVLAALHLESLRFGKRRREGSDDTFNAAVNGHPRGWAQLRPLFPPGSGGLMSDDHARPQGEPRFFAAGGVWQVQLGDHVVFWYSIMYGLLDDGAWSLENAVVVGVESNWQSNDVGYRVSLMGHGTGNQSTGDYAEDMARYLDGALERARVKARAAGPGVNSLPWLRGGAPLVRWAPYGEAWVDENNNPQDPWWMRVPFESVGDWVGRALGKDATLKTLPDAVQFDPDAGFAGPPPAAGGGPAGACYFPLWWPAQPGRWPGYIQRRKDGHVPATFKLAPAWFHRGTLPGLVYPKDFTPDGTRQQVYTVRPFVTRS